LTLEEEDVSDEKEKNWKRYYWDENEIWI